MGGTSMGIAGSIVDPSLFEQWLGMRVESVDMTEFIRRIERGIFDKAEFDKAMKWVKANCKEGKDWNGTGKKRSRKQLDSEWETSVKRVPGRGVELILRNTAPYAQYLALGTVRMKAHGPFTSAMARQLATVNKAWLAIAREARARGVDYAVHAAQVAGVVVHNLLAFEFAAFHFQAT
jgi:L-fucose isomerase-like protein